MNFLVKRMLEFLGSKAPLEMIELFCKNPNTEFYSKEIQEELDLSKATNIKWLKNLKKNEIITEKSSGRKKYYKLKWGSPISRQLRVLVTLSELIPPLRDLDEIKNAYLVGSSAKGTDSPDSPLELLIMKRGDSKSIKRALNKVSESIGREIEARVMLPVEYAEMSRDKPKLHEKLEREKIRLPIS